MREEKGGLFRTWTFWKDSGAEKKAKENQREKGEKFLRENLEKGVDLSFGSLDS